MSHLHDDVMAGAGGRLPPGSRPRAMGAVVDAELRVIGLDALHVVDASVLPAITCGITNAPTIMIAATAADLIRGRAPLPRARAAVEAGA